MRTVGKALSIAVLSISLLAIAGSVRAQNPGNPVGGEFAVKHPRRNQVNKRVRNQRGRIDQGVKNGSLTAPQAQQLRGNERAIKQQEHAEVNANGGYLTKAQKRQLNQEENANSKLIHDEKHPVAQ